MLTGEREEEKDFFRASEELLLMVDAAKKYSTASDHI
jgi:hypothetical protein